MDPIWASVPSDIADHICNSLPKVRRLNPLLKWEIENNAEVRKLRSLCKNYCDNNWGNFEQFIDFIQEYNVSVDFCVGIHKIFNVEKFGSLYEDIISRFAVTSVWVSLSNRQRIMITNELSYHDELRRYGHF